MSEAYTYDADTTQRIGSVTFDILGNNETERMSALGKDSEGIDVADLFDNTKPKTGGLIDPRLGSINKKVICKTCGLISDCIGHPGHIKLAEPVFHMGYIPYVKKILSCICLRCSKLLLYKNVTDLINSIKTKTGRSRMSEVRNNVKSVLHCQHPKYGCGTPVTKIKIEKNKKTGAITLTSELTTTEVTDEGNTKSTKKSVLTPRLCYHILKNISDDDCVILGFDPRRSRPEDMIYTIFPVPPVQIRPSARADFSSSSTMEDDLTHKLADIIRANIRVRKYKESLTNTTAKYEKDHTHLLQYHTAAYIDNDSLTLPQSEQKGKPVKSLSSRLKGKGGRVRGNLMGKRVDFSARTVITPDPTIDINELGVPIATAMNVTFPEVVTSYNIERLQHLVLQGRDNYPGANFVFPSSRMVRGGKVLPIDLRYRREKVNLMYGDVVERHIVDGDYVLLNRQPTLHKLSMMGHKIKVIHNHDLETFRLNVAVTTPYNADFDGDEMNIFIPQSMKSMIELQEIADVKRQIITPRLSVPIIGIVQDGLLGSFNLTKPTMTVDWHDVMNIVSYTSIDDFSNFKKQDYKGADVFSMIIPSGINTSGRLKIKDGKIIKGVIDKSALGSGKKNSLIHLVWDEYGIEETKKFIDNVQRLINNFNLYNGFSVGIGDVEISPETEAKLEKMFETEKLKVLHMITEMENNPDFLSGDIFEMKVFHKLNNLREKASKLVMDNLSEGNSFNIMITSGSKGKAINMGQMAGCIGQQGVEGKRILKKVNGRSMHYFHRDDDSAAARGFVQRPFLHGSTLPEFLFINMSAREGLIDTAIKSVTPETQIIVLENGVANTVQIGDWIDAQLKHSSDKVEHHVEREMELLKLADKVYVPTTDSKGHMTWGQVTAITRHDPGKELFKIVTHGGREVIVTESKSLLVWDEITESFERKDTPLVKVGEFVPVSTTLPAPPVINEYANLNTSYNLCLNRETGVFIGTCMSTNISNDFIAKWAADRSITVEHLNAYLQKSIGFGTSKLTIPNEAITGSNEFVTGILDGYFSNNSVVTHNSIQSHCESKELLTGIALLCNRLGIFATLSEDTISIEGQWASLFARKVHLSDTDQNTILATMKPMEIHANFAVSNDVVLDKIVSITKVDVKDYPKVYDMTVPSTLNFGLANGLQVVDTAESGYVQRKLIKAMEDVMIKYDGTCRNANNRIIQFIYGDNGIDTTRQSSHTFKSIKMSNTDMRKKYSFTDSEMKKFKWTKKKNDEHMQLLLSNRDELRHIQKCARFNYMTIVDSFMLPCNLHRLIETARARKTSKNEPATPDHIINRIKSVVDYENTKLLAMTKEDAADETSWKHFDESSVKIMLKYALYEFLSPRMCLVEYSYNKEQVDYLFDEIIRNYNLAIAEPGEMVGIIAAQSTGEPVTQMSARRDSKVIIKTPVGTFSGEIGEFVDQTMKANSERVIELEGNSQILDLKNDYFVCGLNDTENISWNRISQLSRHPTNGNMVKVTTRSGKSTTATLSHSFLTRTEDGVCTIRGDKLSLGMRVPIAAKIPMTYTSDKFEHNGVTYTLNEHFGWFCGAYLAEGSLNGHSIRITNNDSSFKDGVKVIADIYAPNTFKQNKYMGEYGPSTDNIFKCKNIASLMKHSFGSGSYNKKIPAFAFTSNIKFVNGLLQGYFDGDGNVTADSKHATIRCGSRSELLMSGILTLLSYNGIFATKLKEFRKSTKKTLHTLVIPKKYASLYKSLIGSKMTSKNTSLDAIIEWNTRSGGSSQDNLDKIPGLGKIIAELGHTLKMPGASRTYGRWKKKESIGRRTLNKYIGRFEEKSLETKIDVSLLLNKLKQATNSSTIWDEIVNLEIIDDPKELVYDFTVPGNDSFMVDDGVIVHNTLNTFHHSGIASMGTSNLGVGRVKELLSFTKNPKEPVMAIYLNEEIQNNRAIANKIAFHIEKTTIGDMTKKIEIYYDPDPFKKGGFMEQDNVYNVFYSHSAGKNACQADVNGLPWLMRISLDREKMLTKEVSLLDIKAKFCSQWENRFAELKGVPKAEKQLLEMVTKCAIVTNYDNSPNPMMHIRLDMHDFNMSSIIAFQEIIITQFKLKGIGGIKGIKNVNSYEMVAYGEDQEVKKEEQFVIHTDGINMTDIRYIKNIDLSRTVCNNVVEIFKYFGIEAARASLLREMRMVFETSGNDVNYQHLSILIDVMTNSGGLVSVDRHGMNKSDADPLARASFERTIDQLLAAAVFAETDHMRSVSSRIMAGQMIKGGTGMCDLMLDMEKVRDAEYVEDIDPKYKKNVHELTTDAAIKDIMRGNIDSDTDDEIDIFIPE